MASGSGSKSGGSAGADGGGSTKRRGLVRELPVFPQFSLSSSQGKLGVRKWVLLGGDLDKFLISVCKSHWPKDKNTRPVMIQVGAWDEKLKLSGGGGPNDPLPKYKETLIVAQYQFLPFDVPFPHCIAKPKHPQGTTLSITTHNSGQFLTMPPGAFIEDGSDKQIAFTTNENCRIVIPITEYHLTCDRLLPDQVPQWKHREGTVNKDSFLGEKPETLLFETGKTDPSYVPEVDVEKIPRYKLTCVVRSRDIPVKQPGLAYAGWNHDYHYDHWVRIKIKEGTKKRDRYRKLNFADLFTNRDCRGGGGEAGSSGWVGSGGSDGGSGWLGGGSQ